MRDVIGIGRNVVIEILEFFDRVGYTRRVGDAHRLRTLVHLPEAFLEAMRGAGRDTSGDSPGQAPMA